MKPSSLRKYMSAAGAPELAKTYEGRRCEESVVVTVDGRPLPERKDLYNHSPTGFEWGYGGSGPAQLALALLADHLGDGDQALALYQEFKRRVVAALPFPWWKLTSSDIEKVLKKIGRMPADALFTE
ncbi:MAG: DUF6166 domain-containing protein [Limisphaerales bacterium]